MKIENRDAPGTNPIHNSGSFKPTPAGAHHDPRAGGPISPNALPSNRPPFKIRVRPSANCTAEMRSLLTGNWPSRRALIKRW